MTWFCACKPEKQHLWPGTAIWIYSDCCGLEHATAARATCGFMPWLGTASCQYLQLLGKDGILPDGVDPQPLICILIRRLPSLDVPQHPPVHVVAPHLPWAGRGKNLIKKNKICDTCLLHVVCPSEVWIVISIKHGISWVGSDPRVPSSSPGPNTAPTISPCAWVCCPKSFWALAALGLWPFPGEPVPVTDHPHGENLLLTSRLTLPWHSSSRSLWSCVSGIVWLLDHTLHLIAVYVFLRRGSTDLCSLWRVTVMPREL